MNLTWLPLSFFSTPSSTSHPSRTPLEQVREFASAAFNPAGETVAVGSFNNFRVYTLNMRRGAWEEAGVKTVENLYTVTALGWKPDGSRLSVGALCGNVDLYDACIRRHRYKGKFEFTYVSNSNVIVKRLNTGARIVLKSHFGYEVSKINIYQDRFLVRIERGEGAGHKDESPRVLHLFLLVDGEPKIVKTAGAIICVLCRLFFFVFFCFRFDPRSL